MVQFRLTPLRNGRDNLFVEPAMALRRVIKHFATRRTPGAPAPYDGCLFTKGRRMAGIDGIGKRTADAASPPSEGSPVSRPSSPPQLAAPEGLRRRTDSGYVAGYQRADVAPRQAGLLPPRGAHAPLSSANPVAPHLAPSHPLPADTWGNIGAASPSTDRQQAAPVAQPSLHPTEKLDQFASDLEKLTPLIHEVKDGLATPTSISKRAEVISGFRNAFDPDGFLRPALADGTAQALHNKLQAIRQSHPQVAEALEAAMARPASKSPRLDQFASDLQKLIPLIHEVKTGLATPASISKRPGVSSGFSHAFNPNGTLKPASANNNAQSTHNKLQAIRQSHPQVAEAFEAALARPASKLPQLERFASDLEKLIPLIDALKKGRATPASISKQPGVFSSFRKAFNPDGSLKPAPTDRAAQAIHNKLQAIRQSHPQVAEAFEAAMAKPKGKEPSHSETPALASDVPRLRINDFGVRRHELAQRVLQIRQHAVSLEAVEPEFPGLSRLIDPSGHWRSDLGAVLDDLVAPSQRQNFIRLIDELNALLQPRALPPGEPAGVRSPAPSRMMFDLNEPWHEPVKREVIVPPPAPRVPVLVETQLDQARTAFHEELAQVCDLTGDKPQWSSRLAEAGGLIVHHPMQPVPGNDDKFPLRDPHNPGQAHWRYAGADGKCHPNVELKKIRPVGQEMHKFLHNLCVSDPRLLLDPSQLSAVMQALTADAQQEFERLIREQPRSEPRCRPIKLSAADVQDHEQALIGQYGLFAARPSDPAEYPTLSNGRILGFYMGAMLENESQREQAQATHPDSNRYALDADRRPRHQRGRPDWGGAGKRTQVTYAGLGSANSMAFANTALRRPDPGRPEPAYDQERINALFLPFDVELSDKNGARRNEAVVALVALDNLFPPGDDRPQAQVLVDYGTAYLANFDDTSPTDEVSAGHVKHESESPPTPPHDAG